MRLFQIPGSLSDLGNRSEENLAKMAFPQYACMDAAVRRPGGRVPKVGALGANSRCL